MRPEHELADLAWAEEKSCFTAMMTQLASSRSWSQSRSKYFVIFATSKEMQIIAVAITIYVADVQF